MTSQTQTPHSLATLSPSAWASFGADQIAYLRPVALDDGGTGFAAHSARGDALFVAPSAELARAALVQNGLEPLSVH